MNRAVFLKKKNVDKDIAQERIIKLFAEAKKTSQELADRYIFLARKIATKLKVRIPKELKRQFCKECGTYFRHGKNVRVRLSAKKVVLYCLSCKEYTRIPYK